MNVNAHYRPHPMIQRAQAEGVYRDKVRRADELRQAKIRDYENRLISENELKKYVGASTDSLIRYLENPCCYIY